MLSRLAQRIVAVVLIAAVAGCGDMTPPLQVPKLREPAYGWEFENEGDHRLYFVRLYYEVPQGEVDATGGQLGPGDSTLWNVGYAPIPRTGRVVWERKDAAGRSDPSEQVVEIRSRVPDVRRFTGWIRLRYLGPERQWVVSAETREQRELRMSQGERPSRLVRWTVPTGPGRDH
jgi:hypothetical protein